MPTTSRRTFLQAASSGALTAAASVSARAWVASPSRTLRIGLIGCGGRGSHDAGLFAANPDTEIAYVCDPDEGRRAVAAKAFGVADSHAVGDMRQVLADDNVDAV